MVLRRKFASDASFELIVVSVRSVSLLCPVSARSLSDFPGMGCPRAATPHNPGEVTLPAPRAHVQGCDHRREPTGPHSPTPPRILGRPGPRGRRGSSAPFACGQASTTPGRPPPRYGPAGCRLAVPPGPGATTGGRPGVRQTAASGPASPAALVSALRTPHHAVRPEPFLPLRRRCSLSPVFTAALTEASRAPFTPR